MDGKIKVEIDFREKTSGIIEILDKEYNDKIDYSFCNLETGDYILEKKVIFERKTLPDLLQSIKDGRIFRQAYKMHNHNMHCVLILEGIKNDIRENNMKRETIQGTLIHLSVFLGIPILRSKNINETVKLLYYAGKQINNYKLGEKKKIYLQSKKSHYYPNIFKEQVQLLQNLPGIGTTRAIKLLESFGSIREIVLADQKQLKKVYGIGKGTAEKLFLIFNTLTKQKH